MKMKVIVLVLGLVLLASFGLYGCGGGRELTKAAADDSIPKLQKLEPADKDSSPVVSEESTNQETTELIALADTLEEAERIAELYGIGLSTYSYGVATYTTDKNPLELMALGEENGYPALTLNYENELHTEQ